MGNCYTSDSVLAEKKVIIVGASFAGLSLAEQLWDFFDVLIIDKNDYFEYTCNNPSFLVKDERINAATLPYHQMIRSHGNKASFVQGVLKKVNDDNSIVVDTADEGDQRFDFDFLVICTGAEYSRPTKDNEIFSLEERKSRLALEQQAVKQAESILVVGGGAVGVEVVAELAMHFNHNAGSDKKRLGIIARSASLLPYFPAAAQQAAVTFMEREEIQMHLSQEFEEDFLLENKYEHVLFCQGARFNADFMQEEFEECMDRGQILVNDFLQVTNMHPLKKNNKLHSLQEDLKEAKVYENIFCIGDACLTSANEEKSVAPLKQQVEICASNIVTVASSSGKLKAIPRVFAGLYTISLGPEEGIIVINDYVKVGPSAAQIKRQVEENYMGSLRGESRSKEVIRKQDEQIQQFLCCCNTLCCCCPCATKARRGAKRKERKVSMD